MQPTAFTYLPTTSPENIFIRQIWSEVAERLYGAYSFNEQVDVIIKWLRGKIKSCPTPEANNRIVKLASDPDIIHLSKYHQIVCAHRFGYGTVPRPNRVRQEE